MYAIAHVYRIRVLTWLSTSTLQTGELCAVNMNKRFAQEHLTPHYWLVSSIVPDLGPGLFLYSSGEDGRVLHTSIESGLSSEVSLQIAIFRVLRCARMIAPLRTYHVYVCVLVCMSSLSARQRCCLLLSAAVCCLLLLSAVCCCCLLSVAAVCCLLLLSAATTTAAPAPAPRALASPALKHVHCRRLVSKPKTRCCCPPVCRC